jgi:chromosome segregation protein
MRELDRRAAEAGAKVRTAQGRSGEISGSLDAVRARLEGVIERLDALDRELLGLDHALGTVDGEVDRASRQLRVAQSETSRLEAEQNEIHESMERSRRQLDDVRVEKSAIDQELEARSAATREIAEVIEKETSNVAQTRSELAVTAERKDNVARDVEGFLRHIDSLETECGRMAEAMEAAESERSSAGRSIEHESERRAEVTREADRLRESISAMLGELESLRSTLREAETRWDETRGRHDEWKDRSGRLQVERAEIESDLKHLVSACRSELGENIESVCLDHFENLSPGALEAAEAEHQELRQKLDAMGAVNMMAVEEYEEAEQRFAFLFAQRQDLLDSIRDTTAAIKEIESVSKKQFAEAYADINVRFTEAFVDLFGGGHGELRLIEDSESGDDSDAGIEIVAQPPGKKLQNVLLLSGGEKALTALALLIALFRFKPSPFCVLDEVDAPLDEANVERFANMVRSMSQDTQFIVITHSKRTMETASQLYGVTMEEAGVSKVVSVRLN